MTGGGGWGRWGWGCDRGRGAGEEEKWGFEGKEGGEGLREVMEVGERQVECPIDLDVDAQALTVQNLNRCMVSQYQMFDLVREQDLHYLL